MLTKLKGAAIEVAKIIHNGTDLRFQGAGKAPRASHS